MKSIVTAIALGLASLYLMQTNPYQKDAYLRFVAHQLQADCCQEQVQTTGNPTCRVLSPVVAQFIRSIFSLYTEQPRNYRLFTVHSTELPHQKLRVIGVGGHFIPLDAALHAQNACELMREGLLGSTLGSTQQFSVPYQCARAESDPGVPLRSQPPSSLPHSTWQK